MKGEALGRRMMIMAAVVIATRELLIAQEKKWVTPVLGFINWVPHGTCTLLDAFTIMSLMWASRRVVTSNSSEWISGMSSASTAMGSGVLVPMRCIGMGFTRRGRTIEKGVGKHKIWEFKSERIPRPHFCSMELLSSDDLNCIHESQNNPSPTCDDI